jgi:hypothetical protein
VTSLACNFSSDKSCIKNIVDGGGIACLCSGGVPVTDEVYIERKWKPALELANLKMVCTEDEYKRLANNAREEVGDASRAKIPLRCRECNISSDKSWIVSILQGGGIACLCSGGVPVTDDVYIERKWKPALELAKLEMVCTEDEYKRLANKAREDFGSASTAKIPLRCRVCDVSSEKSWIVSILQGGGIACLCSGGVPVTDDVYIERKWKPALKLAKLEMVCTEDEYKSLANKAREDFGHANKAKIPLICLKCGINSEKSYIDHIIQGSGISCKCNGRKTELKLLEWLQTVFPTSIISSTWTNDGQKKGPISSKKGITKYDFVLTFETCSIIIELDGAQHFNCTSNEWGNKQGWDNDLLKETYARDTLKIPMVRVLQEEVWGDYPTWQTWVSSCISSIQNGSNKMLWTPDRPEYNDALVSEYAKLRADSHPQKSLQSSLKEFFKKEEIKKKI